MSNSAVLLRTDELGKTDRIDRWWLKSLAVVTALGLFTVYVLWATFQNAHYEIGPYLSPFYSPNLKEYLPGLFEQWQWLSPAFLVLWAPLLFRGTCYYGRKMYYRAMFTPPNCAVGGSQTVSKLYDGERSFPFVLMNLHRIFFYVALVLVVFHWIHFIQALQFNDGFGIGVGTVVVLIDAVFLSLYVFSCHSLRHLVAGKLDCFSCSNFTETRYKSWLKQTWLNERHGLYFWLSLASVLFADVYIRMVSMGEWTDVIYIFGQGVTYLSGEGTML